MVSSRLSMSAGVERIRTGTKGRMPVRAARCWVWSFRALLTPPIAAIVGISLELAGVPTYVLVIFILVITVGVFAVYFLNFHVGVSSMAGEYGFRRQYARGLFASYRRGPEAFDEMWNYVQSKPDRFTSDRPL